MKVERKAPEAAPDEYDPSRVTLVASRDLVTPEERGSRSQTELDAMIEDNASTLRRKVEARAVAQAYRTPEVQAAALMDRFGRSLLPGMDLDWLIQDLKASNARIAAGDMSEPEAILFSQANALGSIFTSLASRALAAEYLPQYDTHMRLALKAQAQCRATLEALAEMKNPRPVAFVKQANITSGPQQVNNGTAIPSLAEKPQNAQNELSRVQHESGQRVDFGTVPDASPARPDVAAVEAIDRATDSGRESKVKPQCLQGRDTGYPAEAGEGAA